MFSSGFFFAQILQGREGSRAKLGLSSILRQREEKREKDKGPAKIAMANRRGGRLPAAGNVNPQR